MKRRESFLLDSLAKSAERERRSGVSLFFIHKRTGSINQNETNHEEEVRNSEQDIIESAERCTARSKVCGNGNHEKST
jgi:hypothetical protein